MSLLSITDLSVNVGSTKILHQVSMEINQGEIVGVVGGSGSGKTTLGMAVMGLLPAAMTMTGGKVLFEGRDIGTCTDGEMRTIRGVGIGMVFQEPLSAFDPLFTMGEQLDETLRVHTNLDGIRRRERIMDVFKSVEIDDPQRIYNAYPHQLSGGLRQRAMIAQAVICHPRLIIADEATSSLDVTIQAKIMRLLKKLNKEQKVAVMLISHDLGMVGHLADHIVVMSQGCIVESGEVSKIMQTPKHPYTQALLEAY